MPVMVLEWFLDAQLCLVIVSIGVVFGCPKLC